MKKSIGLDIGAPENVCEDNNCAWHGTLSVRGKSMDAVVKSAKTAGTVIVELHYNKFMRKYERYERRKIRLTAHNPACIKAKQGDKVVIAECRPISKTKSFVVVGFVKEAGK